MNLLVTIWGKILSMVAKLLLIVLGWSLDTIPTLPSNSIVTLISSSSWDYLLIGLYKLAYPSLSLPNQWVLPSDQSSFTKMFLKWIGFREKQDITTSCIVPTKKISSLLVSTAKKQNCSVTVCGLDYNDKTLKVFPPNHEKSTLKEYLSDVIPLYPLKSTKIHDESKRSVVNKVALLTALGLLVFIFIAFWFFKISPFYILSFGSFLFGMI
jgi:hypothetical protein